MKIHLNTNQKDKQNTVLSMFFL